MKFLRFFYIITLCFASPAMAQESTELIDGTIIKAYRSHQLPPGIAKPECDGQAFLEGDSYQPLADGKHETSKGQIFMMENGCVLPQTGAATLDNGETVEFYQQGVFNENGEVVFIARDNAYSRLPDSTYTLQNGQIFSVTNGHIDNYGLFHDGKIFFEDRD